MQNLIATTFEVVHYIALQAVHYKPLQEVHLSRYNQVIYKVMNAFFYPSKRGINFAKIRGFKVTDYTPSAKVGFLCFFGLRNPHFGPFLSYDNP